MQKGETKKNTTTKVDAVKASAIKSEIDKKEPVKVSEAKVEVKPEAKASTTKAATKTTKSTTTSKKESVAKKTTTKAKKPTAAKAKKTAAVTKKVTAKEEVKEEVKVNLAEVIGNAEIKLIPNTSSKTSKEYPISAAVKNLGLIKEVAVRYTTDNWASFEEEALEFKYQEGDFELWSTTISFDEKYKDSFMYCLRYTINDITRWDNNEDNDYTF